LLELSFANPARLKKDGRSFNCPTCPDRTKKLRRCRESREDFIADDGPLWPMQISKGGEYYGFCPAKATWDKDCVDYFNLLIICAETGALPFEGGIMDQEYDFIENFSWFLLRWDMLKFMQKADMILGDSSTGKALKK